MIFDKRKLGKAALQVIPRPDTIFCTLCQACGGPCDGEEYNSRYKPFAAILTVVYIAAGIVAVYVL